VPIWLGRRIVTCAEAMAARDGRRLEAAGLVLVRQSPGSAKGVMFITLEEKTGVANVVVWPSFEPQRRVVLSAGMMAVRGKTQREGAVVHLVAHHLTNLSEELASSGRMVRNGRRARCDGWEVVLMNEPKTSEGFAAKCQMVAASGFDGKELVTIAMGAGL
jgi:DNA polymerase III alpha subunit